MVEQCRRGIIQRIELPSSLCEGGRPETAVALLTAEEIVAIVEKAVNSALAAGSPTSEILTRDQVAEMLKVHPATVTHYVKKCGLRGVQLNGGDWRFRRADIDTWLERRVAGEKF